MQKQPNQLIIGLMGVIGSGKGTVADILVQNYKFQKQSFAGNLKTAVASIFGWSLSMLEGDTEHSRLAREVVDEFWAEKLGIPNLTPRLALQLMGTEVMRRNFHSDIWIYSTYRSMPRTNNLVFADVRFPNEAKFIQDIGGILIKVNRYEPDWWPEAVMAARGSRSCKVYLEDLGIHESEWSWAAIKPTLTIKNQESLEDLQKVVQKVLGEIQNGHY